MVCIVLLVLRLKNDSSVCAMITRLLVVSCSLATNILEIVEVTAVMTEPTALMMPEIAAMLSLAADAAAVPAADAAVFAASVAVVAASVTVVVVVIVSVSVAFLILVCIFKVVNEYCNYYWYRFWNRTCCSH